MSVSNSVSTFDSTKAITQTEWATTLICMPKSFHAMIFIEGKNASNEYFKKYIHLKGQFSELGNDLVKGFQCYFGFGKIGRVYVKSLNDAVRYSHKSETWIRSAEKVQAMISEAELEQNNQLANPRAFNIFGRKSIFAKEVQTFKISDPFLQEVYKIDPHSLMKLYYHALSYANYLSNADFDPFSAYLSTVRIEQKKELEEFEKKLNVESEEYASKQESYVSNIPKNPIGEFGYRLLHEAKSSIESGKWEYLKTKGAIRSFQEEVVSIVAVSSIKKFIKKYQEIAQKIRANLQEDDRTIEIKQKLTAFETSADSDVNGAFRELLTTVANGLEQVNLQPDSCFTWAREKLLLIDVSFEDKSLDRIASITKLYLQKV